MRLKLFEGSKSACILRVLYWLDQDSTKFELGLFILVFFPASVLTLLYFPRACVILCSANE